MFNEVRNTGVSNAEEIRKLQREVTYRGELSRTQKGAVEETLARRLGKHKRLIILDDDEESMELFDQNLSKVRCEEDVDELKLRIYSYAEQLYTDTVD